jgi:hypothetical protein
MKQGDLTRRIRTAEIIDFLSQGVAIQSFPYLIRQELLYFLTQGLYGKSRTRPLPEMVWTTASGILGDLVPTQTPFPQDVEEQIQLEWIDHTSTMAFSSIVRGMGESEFPQTRDDTAFQQSQNEKCRVNRDQFKTFEEARLNEVRGLLDAQREDLIAALMHVVIPTMPRPPSEITDDEASLAFRYASNLIYEAYRLGKITTECPMLDIGSGIHAAMRYEGRSFKKGDLYDHYHAACALPFCDLMLTERAMGTLLTSSRLDFHRKYDCQVVWKDDDALEALRSLG